MITKKKMLYLGLLLALLGVGNGMQAYKLIIKNKTPFKVKFKVSYHGEADFYGTLICQPDSKELKPKESTELSSGACTVLEVTATVLQHSIPGKPYFAALKRKSIKAKRYYASAGRAGNTTFTINGPTIKKVGDKSGAGRVGPEDKSEVKYTVTRK